MNVSLTPRLEQFIERKVKAGSYQTASEVVREALRLLAQRDSELDRLRAELRPALAAIERGEYSDLDIKQIKVEGRKRLAARRMKKVG